MYAIIYRTPLWIIFSAIFALLVFIGWINEQLNNLHCASKWRQLCFFFATISTYSVIHTTILTRTSAPERTIQLIPFRLVLMVSEQPEVFRSIVMNVLLFVPFGIFVACVFSKKTFKTKILVRTTLIGCFLSGIVECLQYFLYLRCYYFLILLVAVGIRFLFYYSYRI